MNGSVDKPMWRSELLVSNWWTPHPMAGDRQLRHHMPGEPPDRGDVRLRPFGANRPTVEMLIPVRTRAGIRPTDRSMRPIR